MTTEIEMALIKNQVDVGQLIKRLCATSVAKNKNVPLFGEEVFENVKSINKFWKKLNGFWTIFDYDLLELVIELSDCNKAQDIFKDFLSKIDFSAIKEADLMLHCKEEHWEGLLKSVLRVKVNVEEEKCTDNLKETVKKIVAETFDLERYALQLKCIKKGCIEVSFYISEPLKLYLLQFVITRSAIEEFLVHTIVSLCIDDEFELKIPYKVDDTTVSSYT